MRQPTCAAGGLKDLDGGGGCGRLWRVLLQHAQHKGRLLGRARREEQVVVDGLRVPVKGGVLRTAGDAADAAAVALCVAVAPIAGSGAALSSGRRH